MRRRIFVFDGMLFRFQMCYVRMQFCNTSILVFSDYCITWTLLQSVSCSVSDDGTSFNMEHEHARPSTSPSYYLEFERGFCQNWKPGKSGELSSALSPVDSDIKWFYMAFKSIIYQRIYKLDANNILDEIKWQIIINLKTR